MYQLVEIALASPSDLSRLGVDLSEYVFRGQEDASWPLATALERALSRYASFYSIPTNREHWLLHEFRRQSDLYSGYRPEEHDSAEWMAVMQHYGCPTRLMDFSYSIYIATHFAVVGAGGDAAVWALNWQVLRDGIRKQFGLNYKLGETLKDGVDLIHRDLANRFIGRYTKDPCQLGCIYLEPQRFTKRVARQQGLFVMPTDADRPFMENLASAYEVDGVGPGAFQKMSLENFLSTLALAQPKPVVMKLTIPADLRRDFVVELTRMNITAATLFGGLEGLARSLTQVVIWGGP